MTKACRENKHQGVPKMKGEIMYRSIIMCLLFMSACENENGGVGDPVLDRDPVLDQGGCGRDRTDIVPWMGETRDEYDWPTGHQSYPIHAAGEQTECGLPPHSKWDPCTTHPRCGD